MTTDASDGRSLKGVGAVPLYRRIADDLATQIRLGTYRPGSRIPSLRRLQAQYGVSLTTVVEACRHLEDEGLIHAQPQSGHYVRLPEAATRLEPDSSISSIEARRVDASLAVRLNLGIGNPQRPTLGAAVQGAELMPIAALNRLMSQVLRQQPESCHSYDAPPGSPALRRAIAQRGMEAGYSVSPDEIVITSGAKEAVYLSICAVTKPGDTVAIESPAYYALLEVLASLGLNAVEIATHPRLGINLDELAMVLQRQPIAALVLVSNFSNPTGACMSDEAKQQLVDLLERHRLPLVEDDVYGELVFEGRRPKAIKAFDRSGLILYCSSYSKTLSPGLRVGWSIAGRYQNEIELLKLVVNQATATAPQLTIAAFVEGGGFDRHLRRVRRMYHHQMSEMMEAVTRYFPPDTRFTRPSGGHVLWVQLPHNVDAMELYVRAAGRGIRIAPGPMFSPSGGYQNFIRLNTGFPWSQETDDQVRVLGDLVESLSPGSS